MTPTRHPPHHHSHHQNHDGSSSPSHHHVVPSIDDLKTSDHETSLRSTPPFSSSTSTAATTSPNTTNNNNNKTTSSSSTTTANNQSQLSFSHSNHDNNNSQQQQQRLIQMPPKILEPAMNTLSLVHSPTSASPMTDYCFNLFKNQFFQTVASPVGSRNSSPIPFTFNTTTTHGMICDLHHGTNHMIGYGLNSPHHHMNRAKLTNSPPVSTTTAAAAQIMTTSSSTSISSSSSRSTTIHSHHHHNQPEKHVYYPSMNGNHHMVAEHPHHFQHVDIQSSLDHHPHYHSNGENGYSMNPKKRRLQLNPIYTGSKSGRPSAVRRGVGAASEEEAGSLAYSSDSPKQHDKDSKQGPHLKRRKLDYERNKGVIDHNSKEGYSDDETDRSGEFSPLVQHRNNGDSSEDEGGESAELDDRVDVDVDSLSDEDTDYNNDEDDDEDDDEYIEQGNNHISQKKRRSVLTAKDRSPTTDRAARKNKSANNNNRRNTKKKPNTSASSGSDSTKSKKFNNGVWTQEEHERFLEGYRQCGRNWSRIAKVHVKTRERTQIASHAQKWFKKLQKSGNGDTAN